MSKVVFNSQIVKKREIVVRKTEIQATLLARGSLEVRNLSKYQKPSGGIITLIK